MTAEVVERRFRVAPKDQTPGRVARDLAFVALAALPLSMSVGILKYRRTGSAGRP